jgi:hypothetical protein
MAEPELEETIAPPTSETPVEREHIDVPLDALTRPRAPRPLSLFKGQPLSAYELWFMPVSDVIHSGHPRPRTIADCQPGGMNAQRPCPFVSCQFHLAIDVNEEGSIKLNFPATTMVNGVEQLTEDYIDWDGMKHTCALDLVDPDNGMTTGQVGEVMNCVESNVQRIEHAYLDKLREFKSELGADPEEGTEDK